VRAVCQTVALSPRVSRRLRYHRGVRTARPASWAFGVVSLLAWPLACGGGAGGGGGGGVGGHGGGGSGGGAASNPCAFTLSGDVADRVQLNAHLRIVASTIYTAARTLDVTCLQDPPGSQQSGNFPAFDLGPFTSSGTYVVDGATAESGSVVVAARTFGPIFHLVGGDASAGTCTFTATTTPAPQVGDRVDVSFHCEGLTTAQAGTPYAVVVTDGVIGGPLEFVE
jgi:hypothetical protein